MMVRGEIDNYQQSGNYVHTMIKDLHNFQQK